MSVMIFDHREWRVSVRPLPAELFYCVGVPMLMALHLGWHHAGASSLAQRMIELAYFTGMALMGWCSLILCTFALFRLLRPLRPRPWFLWIGGAMLSLPVLGYPKMLYVQLSDLFLVSPYLGTDGPYLSWPHLAQAVQNAPPGIIAWMAVNFFYDRVLNLPRFHYPPEAGPSLPAAASAPRVPEFLRSLDEAIAPEAVVALEACDHYIRVHTPARSTILHCRFGDAVEQMSSWAGTRVHRSYWVAASAVAALEKHRHGYRLLLGSGAHVPVSRTYLKDVKQLLARGTVQGPPPPAGRGHGNQ